MDKKKAVAVVLGLAAVGVMSYALLPTFFGGDEATTPKNDVAKMRAEPPKKSPAMAGAPAKLPDAEPKNDEGAPAGKMPELARVPEAVVEVPEPARAVLPPSAPARVAEERRLQATLRDHNLKKVDHEVKRELRKFDREDIEDEAAMEKALTEADRVKAERAYFRTNPSQLLSKNQGPGAGGPGMPPLPMPSGPGAMSGSSIPLGGFDQPALRMISMVGNEKVAHIEYRGSLYRVKSGDSLATWKVKTVADESVQLSSGKTVKTLQFGLPTGDSASATSPLPPPPGVGGAPRRSGNP